jgi:hypothetical protein
MNNIFVLIDVYDLSQWQVATTCRTLETVPLEFKVYKSLNLGYIYDKNIWNLT